MLRPRHDHAGLPPFWQRRRPPQCPPIRQPRCRSRTPARRGGRRSARCSVRSRVRRPVTATGLASKRMFMAAAPHAMDRRGTLANSMQYCQSRAFGLPSNLPYSQRLAQSGSGVLPDGRHSRLHCAARRNSARFIRSSRRQRAAVLPPAPMERFPPVARRFLADDRSGWRACRSGRTRCIDMRDGLFRAAAFSDSLSSATTAGNTGRVRRDHCSHASDNTARR